MKICMLLNNLQYADGVARSAIGVANLLNDNGYDVTLIPLYNIEKGILSEIAQGVRVQKVFGFYFRGMSRFVGKLPEKFLYRKIVKEKYDVEIAFQYGLSTRIIAASGNPQAFHMAWMHGYDYKMNLKNSYLKMDKMICVSKCNAEQLKKDLEGKVEVDYCYNPINDREVVEKGEKEIEIERPEGLVFVSVGRHSEEKGYARLLDCVSKLKQQHYVFQLWLIGDGPVHSALVEKAKELNLEDYVVFWGSKSNPHAYTSKADLFLCSSYSEGYSGACTEAVMLNVPVLSTAVSGAEEIIADAESGMVVGMEDKELYEGMKYVLDHPEIIPEWKKKLEKTKYRFSYAERAGRLLKILNELKKK